MLENILQYDMTPLEAKAYKVALLWMELARKEFPEYQHMRLKKKGDPRKSMLFKWCFKLIQETQELIDDSEYKLYIQAQLHVLKGIQKDGVHALIDPQCLCGDKAWVRWQVWKKTYDRVQIEKSQHEFQPSVSAADIKTELEQTKKFLFEKFGGQPTYDVFFEANRRLVISKWLSLGKISPYYVILSPWVHKDRIQSDLDVYRRSLVPEVEEFFRAEFDYEFQTI